MSVGRVAPQFVRIDDTELQRCLHDVIRDRRGGAPDIVALHRRRVGADASHPCEIVTVRLSCGELLDVLLKDFSAPPQTPLNGLAARRERERRVYRALLGDANLGTARLYGEVWDAARGRFWLVLEYVAGDRLHWRNPEGFVAAAAWLGRMQVHFTRHGDRLAECPFLLRHDAGFYLSPVDGARRTALSLGATAASRLEPAVREYRRAIDALPAGSLTLVHGSFRKHEVLIHAGNGSGRVCPIDWELAALGSPLFDLASLSNGWKPPVLDRIWEAYRDELVGHGVERPDRTRLAREVACFRLYFALRSLSEAEDRQCAEPAILRLVDTAQRFGRALEKGGFE